MPPSVADSRRADRRTPRASDADDVALLARVRLRDLHGFERLFRSYQPRLRRFLEPMAGRPGIVDEVINDTMLLVWHRADAYNHQSKVSTWIFAIAYRKALQALRGEGVVASADEQDEDAAPDPGPEQQLEREEARSALGRALSGLSFEHRAVVQMTYFHGLGVREIADIVECPVDTVKTRLFHARRRLRAMLAGELGDWL
jgi:RNA polymerase sigma-70 factor (ECF subfamily)